MFSELVFDYELIHSFVFSLTLFIILTLGYPQCTFIRIMNFNNKNGGLEICSGFDIILMDSKSYHDKQNNLSTVKFFLIIFQVH